MKRIYYQLRCPFGTSINLLSNPIYAILLKTFSSLLQNASHDPKLIDSLLFTFVAEEINNTLRLNRDQLGISFETRLLSSTGHSSRTLHNISEFVNIVVEKTGTCTTRPSTRPWRRLNMLIKVIE